MELKLKIAFTHTIMIALLWSAQGRSSSHEVVVAQDGSDNFTTIAKAIEAAPNNTKISYTVHIKEGIYAEYIIVEQQKKNLILIGEGMHKTVITSVNGDGLKTYCTQLHLADNFVADGITFENVVGPNMGPATFENVAGPNMGPAVALMSEAKNVAFLRCRFLGYQDTLYAKRGIQFFRECEIAGTVDFIFGDAKVVFQNCLIIARKTLPGKPNTITAQGREAYIITTGTVLHNCTINGANDLSQETKTYLGRPWKLFARTAIMQSDIGDLIDPQGWLKWDNSSSTRNMYYAEYRNRGMGNDTSHNSHDVEAFTVRNLGFRSYKGINGSQKEFLIFSTYYKHV